MNDLASDLVVMLGGSRGEGALGEQRWGQRSNHYGEEEDVLFVEKL